MGVFNRNQISYGLSQPLTDYMPKAIVSQRAPTTGDFAPLGQLWLNLANQTPYFLVRISAGLATWTSVTSATGVFSSLTVTPGPIDLEGTTTINTTSSASTAIGNNSGASSITLTVGTGGFGLDGVSTSNYAIGASTTSGAIAIGGTAQTGAITLGSSSGTQVLNLGTGAGAATVNIATGVTNAKTVNIGTGAAMANTISVGGTGANVIAIGNTQTAGSVSIGAAMTSGTVSIGGTGAQTGTINIGVGTGAQAINIGTGAGAKAVTIGSTNTTSATVIQAGSGDITLADATEVTGTLEVNSVVTSGSTVAVTAGGALYINVGAGVTSPQIIAGSGAPTFVATKGSLYLRTDGSGVNDRAYIATDGAGTWTAIVTVA